MVVYEIKMHSAKGCLLKIQFRHYFLSFNTLYSNKLWRSGFHTRGNKESATVNREGYWPQKNIIAQQSKKQTKKTIIIKHKNLKYLAILLFYAMVSKIFLTENSNYKVLEHIPLIYAYWFINYVFMYVNMLIIQNTNLF